MICFITQEVRITDHKIVIEDPLTEITKILKIEITKRWSQLIITGKFQNATLEGWNFIGKKNCADAAEKSNNVLWLYEQLNIAFLENSAESFVSEAFNMALLYSGYTKTA